jgi:hypothetical protein
VFAIIAIMSAMSDRNLEPAHTVIAKAGGVDAVAAITGKHVSRIYRWTYPRAKGGTGGVVPHEDATKILRYAAEHDLPISPQDFFALAADSAA